MTFPDNEADNQRSHYPLQCALRDITASITATVDAMGDNGHTTNVDISIAEDCLTHALISLAETKRRASKQETA
ncbi:MAG TPA: hypothetical protein DD465_19410 [Thalassospira sp.]|jgi:hypothetical protein|uniref:hypothetical protein n=1 Tax=Thalassospira xiamenensis TaxID=220697 RepID=UPI000E91BB6F|nr:hypothetical protein [Thalassospira xiamenensis]HBN51285.1 hypothetical protein [Thalassospira sp.]|tara:strand:+ start:4227 stop:4448 length:222 start_codon:yes stop_codon:yes gene_type:complete